MNLKSARNIKKYLARYADPLAMGADMVRKPKRYAVVVPARDEVEALPATLDKLAEASAGDAHLVVVINARQADDARVLDANAALMETLRRAPYREMGVVILDATSPGRRLEPKEGVGRARKIGGDYVVRAFSEGGVLTPIVYMTDADAHVPPDYFERAASALAFGGTALFPFLHRPHQNHAAYRACLAYESALRLYALGLDHARSPYAYFTLGSLIATHVDVYVGVRGVPNRTAGEGLSLPR